MGASPTIRARLYPCRPSSARRDSSVLRASFGSASSSSSAFLFCALFLFCSPLGGSGLGPPHARAPPRRLPRGHARARAREREGRATFSPTRAAAVVVAVADVNVVTRELSSPLRLPTCPPHRERPVFALSAAPPALHPAPLCPPMIRPPSRCLGVRLCISSSPLPPPTFPLSSARGGGSSCALGSRHRGRQ